MIQYILYIELSQLMGPWKVYIIQYMYMQLIEHSFCAMNGQMSHLVCMQFCIVPQVEINEYRVDENRRGVR